jgi:hypothetical protein
VLFLDYTLIRFNDGVLASLNELLADNEEGSES